MVIDSVAPLTDLRPGGGDEITITGSGFPSVITLSDSAAKITFDDDTICRLLTSAATVMTCKTEEFSNSRRRNLSGTRILSEARLITAVFGPVISTETETILGLGPGDVESITPSTASPIIAQELVITLATGYPTTNMNVEDF